MSNPNVDRFQSKAFRDGGMIRMLSYAVRGLPSNFLPGEQRIDREWAIEVYEPELEKLDAFGIQSRWFWSGSVGAALVSLALWPNSLELWRRLAGHEIRRDERGADAPCHLLELIFRHQDVETITRSPTFQIHLFQQSLAVAQACAHHSDYGRMFKQLPPLPDIVELLDQVRRLKGLRHTMTGFRPARVLRRFWVEPERPQVIHSATLSDARALADAAVAISGRNLSTTTLDGIQNRLAGHDTPNELSHPAALAAALVTTAEDAACWPLWTTALSGKGFRQPRGKGRPLKDTATRMQDAIIDANRQKEPARAAVHLFQRLCITIKCWHAQGERLLSNLPPKGQRDLALEKAWQRLDVPLAPELKLDSRPQELLSAAQVSDTEEQTDSDGKPCNRRGKRKRAQGSAGKRLETGRLGEEWVMAHYEDCVFWQRACATGAKLLFRVNRNLGLPREQELPDGSYLTTVYPSTKAKRGKVDGVQVRVIEYALEGIPDPEPVYRLITNWFDSAAAPAPELAALYHRRWTIEESFDELKVHLADRAVILRSKRPELVEQEFYALLLAHAAVRRLMTQAVSGTDQSAEDLSFIHAVRVLRRRLPASGAIPP